ncbi:MAG: zinc/manganese transport system ATP-binding protein [Thermoleophilaceae bacterium]|jgi:zinc/manganese transport system ATP-binding protein|nr:zinc/manganese transport system ATP-binding protein [Thermoleophilaceae bacterium]
MSERRFEAEPGPVIRLAGAAMRYGDRTLWESLDLEVGAGEFLAVIGPNGAGKSTLLRVLLGLERLSAGSAEVLGRAPRRGNASVGYVPQQRAFDRELPLRGRDLVRLGLDGHRWGLPFPRADARELVQHALDEVGATAFADAPIGLLSGGEQQRLGIAQALLRDPDVLLCDEPLLNLDLGHQKEVARLIARRQAEAGTAVVFVTHEVNPVLPMVDRILVLVGGRWALGPPEEVLTTETMTALYRSPVDVLRVRGRIVVVGAPEGAGNVGHNEHSDFTEPLPSYDT